LVIAKIVLLLGYAAMLLYVVGLRRREMSHHAPRQVAAGRAA
jgi:hypothetical protein